jgi:hypothetical protein
MKAKAAKASPAMIKTILNIFFLTIGDSPLLPVEDHD